MKHFLLFTLYAPLAAMGEIAVGERRMNWERPARSAVLGLVAAALGIDRKDSNKHEALETGYGFAVRTDNSGSPMLDYHTAQAPPENKKPKDGGFATRAAELGIRADKLNTILSQREYRADSWFTVALWQKKARWSLEEIKQALECPHYTPYFGRKACPLGFPMNPIIEESVKLEDAFEKRVENFPAGFPKSHHSPRITADKGEIDASRLRGSPITIRRREGVTSREQWQFSELEFDEGVLKLKEEEE